MPDRITLRVSRYRPEQESRPTVHAYQVPVRDGWTVVDGLNHVKDRLDGTLSFRWSCRIGICGGCGVTIDGEPVLACTALLADLAPGPVRIEPLRNFPVIRDLVVEATDAMNKLERLPAPAAHHPESQCVTCMLCYSACPSYGLDPGFAGPAVLALAQRHHLDALDTGAAQGLRLLSGKDGVWGCAEVGECTSACPQGVDPAGAIQRLKLTAAAESVRAFLRPGEVT